MKYAIVGYGSAGATKGYTYAVNDNVRTGDRIQPTVEHHSSHKKFVTTGVIQHAYKSNSAKGQNAKLDAISRGNAKVASKIEKNLDKEQIDTEAQRRITQVYTGKELGISGPHYQDQVRAANLAMTMKNNPDAQMTKKAQETFDSYSAQFMKKGE